MQADALFLLITAITTRHASGGVDAHSFLCREGRVSADSPPLAPQHPAEPPTTAALLFFFFF